MNIRHPLALACSITFSALLAAPLAAQAYTDTLTFGAGQAIASPGSFQYQHGGYAAPLDSATLQITALLRRGAAIHGAYEVLVWDQYADDPSHLNGGWVHIGDLAGGINQVVVQSFALIPGKSYFRDDIANGLKVMLAVNANGCHEACGMVLGKSELILTSSVPEPQSYALMALGLAALGFIARRRPAQG